MRKIADVFVNVCLFAAVTITGAVAAASFVIALVLVRLFIQTI